MPEIAILKAFEGMRDQRRRQGTRYSLQLCLALFTLAVAAGNQGFLAIGDWLNHHALELKELFGVDRIPSYSAIRRILLKVDAHDYSDKVAQFFKITPDCGETVSLDGKTLRGSYLVKSDTSVADSHPAIVLVTAYKRGERLNFTALSSTSLRATKSRLYPFL
jgi:hypothetical protein